MSLSADYFDGKSSRRQACSLRCTHEGVELLDAQGLLMRRAAWSEVEVSERSRHTPRQLAFADGAYAQAHDALALDDELKRTLYAHGGKRESWVVRAQQSWRLSAYALLATGLLLAAAYLWGLPMFARAAAAVAPQSLERDLGEHALKSMSSKMMAPSELPEARQAELRAALAAAVERVKRQRGAAEARMPEYRLEFRKSQIGPNAFALPGGIVVMTDELVKIAPSDDGIVAVLAHELGHVEHRHGLRSVIAVSMLGFVSAALLGDVSSIAAAVPALLGQLKYSRDFEREADAYALAFMREAGVAPAEMVRMFIALRNARPGGESVEYLQSHPLTEDRIRLFEGGTAP
jgi:Zn-dependent protease with chaperone function